MALTPFPVTDWKLTPTPDAASGQLVLDISLTPGGEIQLVAGTQRLVQMVILWLLTARGGNLFDPYYGNPLHNLIGRPSPTTADPYVAMIEQAEAEFIARQGVDAAAGYLSADELVDHFEVLAATYPQPGQVLLPFNIVAQSGKRAPAVIGNGTISGG